jgi:cytochrome c oxidase assembly factor CtaG
VASFTVAPIQLTPIFAIAIMYLVRARTLRDRGAPVPQWRIWCWYLGLALIVATLVSPIGQLSEELFLVHMTEHLLIADLGALLLVLGLTGPLLQPILHVRELAWLRHLAHPVVALVLWAVDFYVWHLPALYQGAIQNDWVHALEHMLMVGCGIAMWMALFGPLPKPSWFGNGAKLGYIVAVRLTGTVLGNIFLWSGTVFYPFYLHGDALNRLSPLADQNIAGAIMMVEESFLTLGLFCWLFLRAARESEERQELLDFARTNGLELSEARAARAVAAGRGAELRGRLEAGGGAAAEPRQRGAPQHTL